MYKIIITLVLSALFSINLYAQEPTNESVTKLYIATFDRAPDKAGLEYWVNESKLSLENIATSFFDQPETKNLYPTGTSTEAFIEAIYTNLFKRDPDTAGAEYWKKDLESGVVNKSVFILAVVNGAKDDDATLLANKTEVGLKFVESGSNDVIKAKEIMANITKDDATVNDALALIASFESTDESQEENKEDTEVPDLSINTSTGASTSTGSTSTSDTSTDSTNSETVETEEEEEENNKKIDDDEILPNF